ncbi:hypothetical protein JKP88DRAFT_269205 [Tribonema minus]|uniref:Uncharacterized protein n=1 Tax=Tribonema minus TaxID=303371 RepID=A0A835YJK4_9STRA|nr:hypothetical protein JKP88DRAFT_269205 [Tribonema minus]
MTKRIMTPPPPPPLLRYEPSAWEQEWIEHVSEWSDPGTGGALCDRMREAHARVAAWDEGVATSQKSGCGALDSRLRDDAVFSRFVYRNTCTDEEASMAIEPLAGLTRHPRALCFPGEDKLIDRGYLVLGRTSPKCATRVAEPAALSMAVPDQRVLLFDLGASKYTSGGGGASQQWFVDTLKLHGVTKLEYWGWEAHGEDPIKVWAELPGDLKPYYHWINIPAHPDPDSSDNPWNFIRSVAKPTDHVFVKLDIDNSPIEFQFMQQLQADPELQLLIDEMFFEHHVNVELMYRYWHTQREAQRLSDTYAMVGGLRRKGMRFHSWP